MLTKNLFIATSILLLCTTPLSHAFPIYDLTNGISRADFIGAIRRGEIYETKLLNNYLSEATRKGNTPLVTDLLYEAKKQKVPLLPDNAYGIYSALTEATENGNLSIIKELLSVENINPDYNSLVCRAASRGHKDVVNLLLRKKTDKATCSLALLYATQAGHTNLVQHLFDTTAANLCVVDSEGSTPVMIAAQNGNTEMMEFFLSIFGVRLRDRNKKGETPLLLALKNNHVPIIKLILQEEKEAIIDCDQEKNTALMTSLMYSDDATVQYLLEKNVNVDARNKQGETTLMIAAKRGNVTLVKEIFSRHQNALNCRDRQGNTALFFAISHNHTDVARHLFERGAEISQSELKKMLSITKYYNNHDLRTVLKEREIISAFNQLAKI